MAKKKQEKDIKSSSKGGSVSSKTRSTPLGTSTSVSVSYAQPAGSKKVKSGTTTSMQPKVLASLEPTPYKPTNKKKKK